jgi:hypothetical protein
MLALFGMSPDRLIVEAIGAGFATAKFASNA